MIEKTSSTKTLIFHKYFSLENVTLAKYTTITAANSVKIIPNIIKFRKTTIFFIVIHIGSAEK